MILEKLQEKFTRYEIARILGARSLQLAMDAPVLLKLDNEDELNYDTLKIAEKELESDVLPITVKRPFPKKIEVGLKRDIERKADVEKLEKKEEKDIKESGEIMELTQPEDEIEESSSEEASTE